MTTVCLKPQGILIVGKLKKSVPTKNILLADNKLLFCIQHAYSVPGGIFVESLHGGPANKESVETYNVPNKFVMI